MLFSVLSWLSHCRSGVRNLRKSIISGFISLYDCNCSEFCDMLWCCSGVSGIFTGHMQPNTTAFQTLILDVTCRRLAADERLDDCRQGRQWEMLATTWRLMSLLLLGLIMILCATDRASTNPTWWLDLINIHENCEHCAVSRVWLTEWWQPDWQLAQLQ